MGKSRTKWAPESYDPKSVGRQQVVIADLVDDEDSSFRLGALSSLQNLKNLHLRNAQISKKQTQALKEALPECEIMNEDYD